MKNDNYFLNHLKICLEEVFENYYELTFGFYDLKKPQELKIKELSKTVKYEVFEKDGKFYILFNKIGKIKQEIYDLEYEIKKDDENFDIDEGLVIQISDLYDNVIVKSAN